LGLADRDTRPNTDTFRYAFWHSDANANADCDSYSNPNTYADCNTDTVSVANGFANRVPDAVSDCDADCMYERSGAVGQ
jgi:hypothetical protein